MTAKVADEVSVSLSSVVDSIHKDVYTAEGGLSSQTSIVFKEEAVGEEEHGGRPDEDESGKILCHCSDFGCTKT